ncbi:PP2C family protein-serine/threonine phosphatase [Lusitaniella coriacea]|uniref:PP2C family protein-serine/threonine phosphatase n=1 Tax=Lusitaniella coriacea TaxID=1983105 RepID=UPI003CEAA6D8
MLANSPGQILDDRYLIIQPQIVLDTKPAQPLALSSDVPNWIAPYLKLFAYRLHVPQVYGQVAPSGTAGSVWLLEYGSFPSSVTEQFARGRFFSTLNEAWVHGNSLRQLNWLGQIARLWDPLQDQGVASSLLNPSLLRINGSVLLLRELQGDGSEELPTLARLGRLWSQWTQDASPTIQPFLKNTCEQLESGAIANAEQLIAALDFALAECGSRATRQYQIYTRTDAGPSRDHNEDACYPAEGNVARVEPQAAPLAIVCDGIGGHDGGEIASHLAINTIQEQVSRQSSSTNSSNPSLTLQLLEEAVCKANDLLSDRNDSEQRHDRQRMGTTLVMALARAHEMYLTHVGDSRIYWIARSGCYQVTLDDDLASREVRLGYTLYRHALNYSNAGALVQALGMSASSRLYPTVNRITLDEDGVFLLCSDGLSDFDRVEQYWETEILPILSEETDIAQAVERLVHIANTQNGHDNVTVALLWVRVSLPQTPQTPIQALDRLPRIAQTARPAPASLSSQGTQPAPPPETPQTSPPPLLKALTLLALLGLGLGGLSYGLFPEVRSRVNALGTREKDEPALAPTPSPLPEPPLEVGNALKLPTEITLYSQPAAEPTTADKIIVSPGTVLQVVQKQAMEDKTLWLKFKTCATAPSNPPQLQPLPPQEGWIAADTLSLLAPQPLTALPPGCQTPTPRPNSQPPTPEL